MRHVSFAAAALVLCAGLARAEPPADDLPKPPDTPLPAFENPLYDAVPGETLRYRVRDPHDEKRVRWFEERVLARTEQKVLLETVETDATGAKTYSVDGQRTGWIEHSKTIPLPKEARWRADSQRDEVLYLGEPRKALRCTRRVREMPEVPGNDAVMTTKELWYSHDAPCTGRVKEFPAQGGGERVAVSWDRRLTPEECEKRAKLHPDRSDEKTAPSAPAGMDGKGDPEPAMG